MAELVTGDINTDINFRGLESKLAGMQGSFAEMEAILDNYLDQSVKTTSGPTFDHIHLGTKGIFTSTKARAYLNAAQDNIPDVTFTKVLLDVESYDPGSNFDTTNHRFVTPVAGYYLVTGNVCWNNVIANKPYLTSIYVDGVAREYGRIISNGTNLNNMTTHTADIVYAAAGKYIELYCYHSSGVSTEDLQTGTCDTWMAVHLLSMD